MSFGFLTGGMPGRPSLDCSAGAVTASTRNSKKKNRIVPFDYNGSPVAHWREETDMQQATFGAGCFWGVEAAFRQVPGVIDTAVGYMGGTLKNPSYQDVCTDRTGHAEVVQVQYDPEQVPYEELLRVFWENHDPTTRNRQGPDVGSQYRSAIFFHSPEQEAAARKSKDELDRSGRYKRP